MRIILLSHILLFSFSAKSVASVHTSNSVVSSTQSLSASHGPSSSISKAASSALPSSGQTSSTTTHASSTLSSSSAAPSQTSPVDNPELDILYQRRLSSIVGSATEVSNIPSFLSTQTAEGNWPDVDYTTGCAARRANWPAQEHWIRLVTLSAAWHGGLAGAEQYVNSTQVSAAVSLGMDWWFARDFTNINCLDSGGTSLCPCNPDDTTLWNTNWFSNIILIPKLVAQACLLFEKSLTDAEKAKCVEMTERSYATFGRSINGVGLLTGANALDVSLIGIDLSILTTNVTLTTDAYGRVHSQMVIENAVKSDGIRADGSFGQHAGILYNGNYGKDFANDIMNLENAAGGTEFSASDSARLAFATLFSGNKWMIYRNIDTGTLHWDFSVLGRFISFPVIDQQATGSINTNLTAVQTLGQQWDSSVLTNYAKSLSSGSQSANVGGLRGNNMFYANDYMVHRGSNYVSSLKMYSSRTVNTECTNSQNPLGFHLSDGTLYTYLRGNEYEDISVAWDWNKIPGTTIDDATPLTCNLTQFTGLEAFVGGASDGKNGVAAMRYTNPATMSLRWQKAWFFLDHDVQVVMVSNTSTTSNRPILSILDQRRHTGGVFIDGQKRANNGKGFLSHQGGTTLWHGGVGYALDPGNNATLSVQVGPQSGNWSTIGTSTQPPATVDLFAAWLTHGSLSMPIAYRAFPGVDIDTFLRKKDEIVVETIRNDETISAIYVPSSGTLMAIFWDPNGGTINFPLAISPLTLSSSGNAALIFKINSGDVTVSDPSQTLPSVSISFGFESWKKMPHGLSKTLTFTLPTGGQAGSSVSQKLYSVL